MTSEPDFIAMLRALAPNSGARGLSDDAAVLDIGGEAIVITHDMMVEGRHWPAGADPADIAWKLVAVNLSDLAAKGAKPIALLLGYTLGDDAWDRRFVEGLRAVLDAYDAPLLGGDTVGGGSPAAPRSLGLTAIGRAAGSVPSRSGAKAGDALFVCGSIGEAMAGHDLGDANGNFPGLHAAFHRPSPLLREGAALAAHVHAMMDVSDGLLLDASRMASASGLGVHIDSSAVPISAELARWLATLAKAERADKVRARLSWGDDYALLFAAPPDFDPPVKSARIGHFVEADSVSVHLDGKALAKGDALGFLHES